MVTPVAAKQQDAGSQQTRPINTDFFFSRDLHELASLIHGESGKKTSFEGKVMIGSSALNRLRQKPAEFGETLNEVIWKPNAYYAAQNKNQRFSELYNKNWNDRNPDTKAQVLEAYQIASGLLRGTIKPVQGHFFFTPKEVKDSKANGTFDFSKVNKVGAVDGWEVYAYKPKFLQSPLNRNSLEER